MVAFVPVTGKLPILSEEQLKDTSRDQYLAYRLGHALQSGEVPDGVAGATIGPCCHARWLTTCVRCLRLAMSIKRRTKAFDRILFFLVNLYLPSWFKIKNNPHCQSGAKHLFFMLELSRDLCINSQNIVHKVLQDNSFFAHPENVIIACLADHREEIRRKAVLYIMAARRDFAAESHPRQFIPPTINTKVIVTAQPNPNINITYIIVIVLLYLLLISKMKAKIYVDLVDWEKEQKTEPPLTMGLSEETILSALEKPLKLTSYPNHTQTVERTVPVVTESCTQKVGYSARHR